MKKINVLLSALTLVITAITSMTSLADDAAKVQSGDTKIEIKAPSEYYITIPEGNAVLKEKDKLTVNAYAFIEYGEELAVSVTSANTWKLTGSKYHENQAAIPYEVFCGDKALIQKTEEILVVPYDTAGYQKEATLVIENVPEATYAGTYEDTLTFNTEVREVTSPVATVERSSDTGTV
ncbi:MAG: LecA/PA-IL family lectin [Alistipes sp.]|nr:LecA/PA-IL family lectin [Alistipes sp.]